MDNVNAVAAEMAREFKQWMIGTNHESGSVLPKDRFEESPERNYNVKNAKIRKFLQYEEQKLGINLGWTDDAEPSTGLKVARFFFARSAGNGEPIRFGETIAMGYGRSPSFLHYEHRTVGINLGWSGSPVFEWQVWGGKSGQPVNVREYFAIYNTKAEADLGKGEFLIFFDRTVGGDIGWPSSQTWADKAKDIGRDLLDKAAKEAAKAAVKALLSSG
jgi:hypothetical protein